MPLDPAKPWPVTPAGRDADRFAALERRLASLERAFQGGASAAHPVVDVLPPAGREGRTLMLRSDHKVYADTGLAWLPQT